MIITQISIDLSGLSRFEYVIAKQTDADSRLIQVQLLDNGKIYVLDNLTTARVSIVKPDKTEVLADCTINNNMVEIVLDANMLAAAGTATAEIILTGSGGDVLTSASFDIKIVATVTGKGAESSSEYKSFKNALATLDGFRNEVDGKATKEELREIEKTLEEVQTEGVTAEVVEAKVTSVFEEKLNDGTIANLMIEDNSITNAKYQDGSISEEKLEPQLLDDLKNAGFIYGADGNKYKIAIDENGKLVPDRIYEISTEGLLCDIQIVEGAAVDATGNVDTSAFAVTDDYFSGDAALYNAAGTNLVGNTPITGSRTIILLGDFSNAANLFFCNDETMYGIRKRGGNPYWYFDDFKKQFAPMVYFKNDKTVIGIYPKGILTGRKQIISNLKDFFFAVSVDSENKNVFVGHDSYLSETAEFTADVTELASIRLYKGNGTDNIPKFKRAILYDRALSREEVEELREKVMYLLYADYYNSAKLVQGMTGLGTASAFEMKSLDIIPRWLETPTEEGEQTIEANGESLTFTNVNQEEPTIEDDLSYAEAVYWLNPINSLEIGDMYNIEAMVYPYAIKSNPYNVEYSTSDPAVIECYYGVLIAKSTGTATITAKVSGTEITNTLEIEVTEAEQIVENFFKVSEGFIYEGNQLIGGDGVNTLKAIIGAIEQAAANGYNGVVFPKKEYHIKPYKAGAHCYIPDNFTVDFNYATLYVDENDYCHTDDGRPDGSVNPYTLFSFGGFKCKDEEGNQIADQYYRSCENSVIRNLNYVGERREMEVYGYGEGDYGEQVKSIVFNLGAYKCKIENINFSDTVGFNIATGMNGFDQWSGTGLDGAVRGCVRYSDFVLGKLDETGLTAAENGDWYYTDFLKLGYNYSDNPTGSKDMKNYKVGKMHTATTYGLGTRWYEIYWFDADKNLIEYRTHQMCLETYKLPENAVYFKINARFPDGAPTASDEGKVDVPHVIRVFPSIDPDRCMMKNCTFLNPHASAISMTGGTNFVLRDIFAENGNSPLGIWSIDYEDGWQCMRHNVNYNIICTGLFTQPGGHNTATVSSLIDTARSLHDTEAVKYINCAISTLQISPKTNDLIAGVTYGSLGSYGKSELTYQLETARLRQVNCVNEAVGVI